MGWLITTMLFLSPMAPASADVVPSRDLSLPLAVISAIEPVNFDLLDYREEIREEKRNIKVEDPHTVFVIKRHIGASIGYDNAIVHGSIGLYVTIAELG